MKVAIVHYWLTGMRGGEKVLESICNLYPDADIFTLVAKPEKLSEKLQSHKITTSFLQKIGGANHYKKMLPLMPHALESFDLTEYDLVISSEAGPAKGVITRPDSLHVCYCHSPMRYIWDLEPQYRQSTGFFGRLVMSLTHPYLRQWDVTTAARVDVFIANSKYVAKRIKKFYRREALVIHPPVDLSRFKPSGDVSDVYICAGQITPYKKIEIAIDAFNQSGRRLDIIGGGATAQLKAMAGPNIRFLGSVDDKTMANAFATAKALIFPGVEDFGLVPLEVMASGRPVIAFGRGGALETVIDGKTGVLFHEQSAASLNAAIAKLEAMGGSIAQSELLHHAEQFGTERFEAEFQNAVRTALRESKSNG